MVIAVELISGLLAIEVPQDASRLTVMKGFTPESLSYECNVESSGNCTTGNIEMVKLPAGNWGFVFLYKDIESPVSRAEFVFPDDEAVFTDGNSFRRLLESKGLKNGNYAILQKEDICQK